MAPYYITSMLSFICHDGEICGEAWHSSVSQSRGVREHDGLTTTSFLLADQQWKDRSASPEGCSRSIASVQVGELVTFDPLYILAK
jgi:hypothetical protein